MAYTRRTPRARPQRESPYKPRVSRGDAKRTPGMALDDTVAQPDMRRMRAYRLDRVREQLRVRDYAAALVCDPINIRYASGSRNMTVWTMHDAERYLFVPQEGPVVLFEYGPAHHLSLHLETIDEIRLSTPWYYFGAGHEGRHRVKRWASELADLLGRHGGGNRRLAVDRCDYLGVDALRALSVQIVDGDEVMEQAKSIKSVDEIACMCMAISVCESGMARMHEHLRPGITENQLWSKLHEANIAMGGEWIETRLLSSGGRTNPWFQECGDRVIRAGDMVSYDTDLIGPLGYCADVSRSLVCGPAKPSAEQRELYNLACEQIHHNIDILTAGMSFRDFTDRAWKIPQRFSARRYSVCAHGVGMSDEWPAIVHADVFDTHGYDGIIQPNMVLCIESYLGAEDGLEGVKLEQQVLVTDRGVELLSTFPFDDDLLMREV